jgi:hypothetical protein
MKGNFLTEPEVVKRLKVYLGAGSQKELAERAKITPQHLCDILKGRRSPAPGILVILGLEKVEQLYRQKGKR